MELEILSIMFACQYFHEYIRGQRFIVHNDHKPLKSIMNKQIAKAPPRIQRFLLRLQKYDFDLEYTKGQLMMVTGTLSLAALQDNTPEICDKEMNYFVRFVMSSPPVREKTRQKLVSETAKDDTLQNYIKSTPVSDHTKSHTKMGFFSRAYKS